jgi:hypothetical protein
VHIFFLVVSPLSQPGALERFERAELLICRLRGREGFLDRLRRVGTREEIVGLLAEADRDSLWETDREASRQVRARQRQDPPPA